MLRVPGKRTPLPLAVTALLAAAGCTDKGPSLEVGLLDLEGRLVDPLKATDSEVTVFLFTSTDCPISNRYAPEVRRIFGKFHHRGVAFWLVYPDPADSVEAIRQHVKDFGYPFAALRDPEHGLVLRTGVQVTPEAAVFGPGAQMVYRGRIDDRYVEFGKARPVPTRRDLEEALVATLEGKRIAAASVPAIGCFIADLR